MSCSRYFGPTQSKYLTQGFYTEMSLEYLGFKQEAALGQERLPAFLHVVDSQSPWPSVHLPSWCRSSSALLPHTCPAVFPEVSPLSCSSVDPLQPSTSAFLGPGSVFTFHFPHSRDFGTFSEDHRHPAHPHLDLSLAFPDRRFFLQAAMELFGIHVPLSQFVSLPVLLGTPGRQALALCFQFYKQLPWEGRRPHSSNLRMRRELATLCR